MSTCSAGYARRQSTSMFFTVCHSINKPTRPSHSLQVVRGSHGQAMPETQQLSSVVRSLLPSPCCCAM